MFSSIKCFFNTSEKIYQATVQKEQEVIAFIDSKM